MAKLDRVIRKLNNTDAKEKIALDESLNEAVKGNTDPLGARIEQALVSLNNASTSSLNQVASVLVNDIKRLAQVIVESHNDQVKRINLLETQLAKSEELGRDNIKVLLGGMEKSVLDMIQAADTTNSFKDVTKQIGEIPVPDLDPLTELTMSVLEKVNEPVVIPARKTKWTFTVIRDDEDLIQKVVVN